MKMHSGAVEVLVVEDDAVARTALMRLLKALQFPAMSAADLHSARQILSRTNPRIVILDLMLPDGNGLELLAEIRRSHRPITVAVVTGISDGLKLHEVTALRPDALFGKPLDVEDFENWLSEWAGLTAHC